MLSVVWLGAVWYLSLADRRSWMRRIIFLLTAFFVGWLSYQQEPSADSAHRAFSLCVIEIGPDRDANPSSTEVFVRWRAPFTHPRPVWNKTWVFPSSAGSTKGWFRLRLPRHPIGQFDVWWKPKLVLDEALVLFVGYFSYRMMPSTDSIYRILYASRPWG